MLLYTMGRVPPQNLKLMVLESEQNRVSFEDDSSVSLLTGLFLYRSEVSSFWFTCCIPVVH